MTIDSDVEASTQPKARTNPLPFSSHVDMTLLQSCSSPPAAASSSPFPSSAIEELESFLKTGRMKEAKRLIRESNWAIDDPVRQDLWKTLIQHLSREPFTNYHYWDTVQQLYGSKGTLLLAFLYIIFFLFLFINFSLFIKKMYKIFFVPDVSDCNVILPAFVDQKLMTTHGLSAEGIKACERVISVIVYNCPAITYAPLIYPLTAILMHFMEGRYELKSLKLENCYRNCLGSLNWYSKPVLFFAEPDVYNCITTLISKSSTFISQTKALHESMWRTVEILARKHMVSWSKTPAQFMRKDVRFHYDLFIIRLFFVTERLLFNATQIRSYPRSSSDRISTLDMVDVRASSDSSLGKLISKT